MELNTVICGNALDVLRRLPADSVDCVITSPPYWHLRDYKTPAQVWGGRPRCKHEFVHREMKNPGCGGPSAGADITNYRKGHTKFQIRDGSCGRCGAWMGELGQEPTIEMFIDHMMLIFDQVRRVLKPSGTCFVNIGDTYWNAKGTCRNPGGGPKSWWHYQDKARHLTNRGSVSDMPNYPRKSQCCIPERFSIAMIDRGWIRRNTIIWWKPQCVPGTARDKFTVDFDYVYFFVKRPRYHFEEQYEPASPNTHPGSKRGFNGPKYGANDMDGFNRRTNWVKKDYISTGLRKKRCVWRVQSTGYRGNHFSTYPRGLVRPMILAGCPRGGVVLDPFFGAGTTGVEAASLGRDWVGIELSEKNAHIAELRIKGGLFAEDMT